MRKIKTLQRQKNKLCIHDRILSSRLIIKLRSERQTEWCATMMMMGVRQADGAASCSSRTVNIISRNLQTNATKA